MPDYTDTNVSNLIINVLDSEKYDELRTGGELSESQLYLVTDDALTPSTTLPIVDGTASTGSEMNYARGDHVHPTDTSRAPIDSPSFTGTPTAPTATAGTSSTQVATTEFVQNAVGAAGGGTVTSVQVQATSPVQSSQNTAQSTSLNTTISLADGYGDTKNPYGSKTANYVLAGPTSGSAAAPTFRALTKADISDLGADVFIAEYGTTTYAQVTQALTDGKIVFAHRTVTGEVITNWYLPLILIGSGQYKFGGIYDGNIGVQYYLTSADVWDNISESLSTTDTLTSWYGTCSTTASTAKKAVTCINYVETTGNILGVLFTTANTAATPTLSINSATAKSIYVGNATPSSTTNVLKWSANTMVYFMFDGTYYRYITSVSAGSVVPSRGANTWSGSCITTANTADKVVSCDNFVLTKGAIISVHCSTANTYTANKITLNVNSTGAKDIYINMGVSSGTNALLWDQNETVTFIYDGEYYRFVCKTKPILTSSAITSALGYTPYDSTNPSGYTSNTGTVTGVTAGAGLNTTSNDTSTDGGTISSSGTLYLTKSGVTAGTYQGITVDKYGRVTSASDQGYITSAPVTSVNTKTGAVSLSASDVGAIADPSSKSSGQYLKYDGNDWVADTPSSSITTWYGTSSTNATTATKVVTCSGFTLTTGAIIGVLFSSGNTANTPKLNVNSTGDKSIYVGNAAPNGSTNTLRWYQNAIVYFMYDGTQYRYLTMAEQGSGTSATNPTIIQGTCNTAANVQTKEFGSNNTNYWFSLIDGCLAVITFSKANTYTSGKLTLNIYGTGDKDIYYNGAVTSSTNTLTWSAGETIVFVYDSSGWKYVIKTKPILTASDVGAIADPSTKSNGQVLTYNGSSWVAQTPSVPDPAYFVEFNETVNWSEVVSAYNAGIPIYAKAEMVESGTEMAQFVLLDNISIANSTTPDSNDYMHFTASSGDAWNDPKVLGIAWDGYNGWSTVSFDLISKSNLPSSSAILKGDRTNGISAATAGTDYIEPPASPSDKDLLIYDNTNSVWTNSSVGSVAIPHLGLSSSTGSGTKKYSTFFRLYNNTTTTNDTVTFLVSGTDDFSSQLSDLWYVVVSVRSSVCRMQIVKFVGSSGSSDPEFGYYQGSDGYWYVGVARANYSRMTSINVLESEGNVISASLKEWTTSSTAPTGWTAVAAANKKVIATTADIENAIGAAISASY